MTDPAEVVREFIESSEGRGLEYTNAAEEALATLVRERDEARRLLQAWMEEYAVDAATDFPDLLNQTDAALSPKEDR